MIRLSGRFRSALIIGGQGIRARKMRTFLSMISLFMGVLAVVVVQAGAETAEQVRLADVEVQMGRDGTRQSYLPGGAETLRVVEEILAGRTDGVALSTTSAIIGEPDVVAVNSGGAPFDDSGAPMYPPQPPMRCDHTGCYPLEQPGGIQPVPGQAIEVMLQAMTGDIRQVKPYRPVSGQWLDFDSAPSLSPRIVINEEAAEGFRRYRVPAELRVPGATVNPTPRIVGVVDDGSSQPMAYVRADELRTWVPVSTTDANYGPGVQVLLTAGTDDLERLLRMRIAAASGNPPEQIQFETVRARKQIADELALYRWIFLGMAALVLLIGVAGILNVGLATVGERVEEFALRRAVGTPRSLLAGIVLAETLLTGLFTAAAAIGASAFALEAARRLLGDRILTLQELVFPWQAGVAGVIAGLVAGLLGGLIPAIRAARIPIATVMRA